MEVGGGDTQPTDNERRKKFPHPLSHDDMMHHEMMDHGDRTTLPVTVGKVDGSHILTITS